MNQTRTRLLERALAERRVKLAVAGFAPDEGTPRPIAFGCSGRMAQAGRRGETRAGCCIGIRIGFMAVGSAIVNLSLLGAGRQAPGPRGRRRRGCHFELSGALQVGLDARRLASVADSQNGWQGVGQTIRCLQAVGWGR